MCQAAKWVLIVLMTSPVPVCAESETDLFGVRQLAARAKGGRQWFADWKSNRNVPPYKQDAQDPLFRNSAGVLEINAGVATAPSGRTRFFVLTPKNAQGQYTAPLWKNVEITAYFKAAGPTQNVPGQCIDLAARSGERHSSDAPCDGTSYHAMLRFDGHCGFKKEIWHTGGYTDLLPDPAPKPWSHLPQEQWIGMKFLCRNCDNDSHVNLQLYVDLKEANDWKRLVEVTDRGGWKGRRANCDRPQDAILKDGYPAVYFRTDYVPIEVKKFSVREVEPLR